MKRISPIINRECVIEEFGRRGTLRNHIVTHTGKKVQKCAECGDSFPRPFILKTHLLTHSGKNPQNCTQSNFASSRAGNLGDHKKTHSAPFSVSSN